MPEYTIYTPSLHPGQQQVVNAIEQQNKRFVVLSCGRRWGKTKLCSVIAIDKALQGKKLWWLAPDYDQSSVGWEYVNDLLKQIPMAVKRKTVPPRELTFPTGGQIIFRTTRKENLLRGSGLDYMIIDEADYIDEVAGNSGNVWNGVLRPSLADRKGGAIFISTPRIEQGYFHQLHQKGTPGDIRYDKNYQSFTFSSYTNPYIESSEWDEIRVDMPSILFRQEILAEFVSSAGARIQKAWLHYNSMPDFNTPGNMSYTQWRSQFAVGMGVDLAISQKETADWVAVAVLGRDVKGFVHVLDIRRMRGSFRTQIGFIKSVADQWNPDMIGVESNGYQLVMAEELLLQSKYTIVPIHSSKDKQMRFAPLEARYEREQVYHLRGLAPEFEQELLGFPNAQNDDQIDAMSLAWSVLGEPPQPGSNNATDVYSGAGMGDDAQFGHKIDEFIVADNNEQDFIYGY